MRMLVSFVVAAGIAVSSHASAGSLCLPETSKARVSLRDQQGIIYFHRSRQELVIQFDYEIEGAQGPVTKLGWIIPVPSKPGAPRPVDPGVFAELRDFTVAQYADGSSGPGLETVAVSSPLVTSEGKVELIRGTGKGGLEGVDNWLRLHGLQTIPEEKMRYYGEKRYEENWWSFIVILFEDEAGLPLRGRLTSARASFMSRLIHYPLLLCADEGVFDLTLYIFARGRIDRGELARFGLTLTELETPEMKQSNRITSRVDLPPLNGELFDQIARDALVMQKLENGFCLYKAYAHGLNDADRSIARWETDFELSAPLGSPWAPYRNILVALAAVVAVFIVARAKPRPGAITSQQED